MTTGYLAGGHHWYLNQKIGAALTVALNVAGLLLVIAALGIDDANGLQQAYGILVGISSIAFFTTAALWIRDGVLLCTGRVNLRGEQLEVCSAIRQRRRMTPV